MRPDLYDHELQGDHTNDLQEGAQRLQALMKQVPDLTVDVRDVIADGDKVVVRAVWSGTDAVSQKKVDQTCFCHRSHWIYRGSRC